MKSIGVLCTTKCTTGCRHCNFNSVPKGEDMPLDVIRALKKSIKQCNDQVEVIFTGGGEPLQWPHLPEAVRLLKNVPGITLRLITSGCLSKNDERFSVLKESLKQARGKIHIDHSFNLFSPTFPQRLVFTLPFVLIEGAYRITFIKMVSGFN
jgi:MoaA/NifB/PqqE/SkfB family radical SAM enzyme